MTFRVYLTPPVDESARLTDSETTRTASETGQPDVPVSFDSFVHWHLVEGVVHERPVAVGSCEFCTEDDL